MKRILGKILFVIAWFAVIGAMIWAYTYITPFFGTEYADEKVQIVFPQLENDADCAIIIQGNQTIMIDTGEAIDADTILATLADYDVTTINYLVLTHPDADHIGGAEGILQTVGVKNVIMPYYTKDNDNLASLEQFFEEEGITPIYPTRTRRFAVGGMDVLIYPPLEKNYSDNNNYSLATLINHEEVSMLFTGDALRKRSEELELVHWTELDLMTIPHHGRSNSNSENFLRSMAPIYGIVTAKTADEIIETVATELQTELYYTGLSSYVFESNGTEIYER